MRLGPVEIRLVEKEKVKPPERSELGATGTSAFGGSLSEEEYNTDLRGSKGIVIYDKMRRSDGRVKATLLACTLPIHSANWSIEPGSDDKRDIDIAAALGNNLMNDMTITWDSFLYHALLMLPFGFSIFEKVWEVADGQVRLKKLAPRLPKTLYKWNLDETGGLRGIQQCTWKGNSYQFIDIPVEKLLVFTNEKEGSNFEGISILRSAYKHWYYKDTLYRIDGIAAERHALGIPKFTHPATADKKSTDNLDAIGQRLYAQEQMYVRLAEGYDLKIEGLSGTVRDIMPSIEHHNREIPASILADFLALGQGDTGSWALSRDKSSFFLMALESVISNITDTVNRYAIPQWVDYNYAGVEAYPKLTCASLERRIIGEYAKAVVDLVTSGVISTDPAVEDTLRDLLKLPPKPRGSQQQSEHRLFKGIEIPKTRRELTQAEKNVNFAEIEQKLDSAEEQYIKAAKAVMRRQTDNLAEAALKIIEAKQLEKVDDLETRYRAEMASEIYGVLLEMFRYGREQVKQELLKQKATGLVEAPIDPAITPLVLAYLKTRAKAQASALAAKLKTFVTFEALRQIKEGIADKNAILMGFEELSDRELINSAQYVVSEAFGFGRSNEAEKHAEEIGRAQYSAILDKNTCSVCEPLDGEEWDYDDPRTAKYAAGNPDCLGKEKCRCLLAYISRAERRNPG